MSETHSATCDGCGKNYRVPSADRTYPCKACGGTVSVAAPSAPASKTTPARKAGTRPTSRSSERSRPPAKKGGGNNIALWVVLGALVVGGVGYFVFGDKSTGISDGDKEARSVEHPAKGEKDLDKVAGVFADLWAEGDVRALGLMIHPDMRLGYQAQLEALKEIRGWLDGSQAFESTATKGSTESLHELGEEGVVFCRWQWSDVGEAWLLYKLSVSPPKVDERIAEFAKAWNSGDETRIKPFLSQADNKPAKMFAAMGRAAERRSWDNLYKTISNPSTSPKERTILRSAERGKEIDKIEVSFDSAEGPWVFHFLWYKAEDAWCLAGFNPPEVEDQ